MTDVTKLTCAQDEHDACSCAVVEYVRDAPLPVLTDEEEDKFLSALWSIG